MKKSFVDCTTCSLYKDQSQIIGESNCADISAVKLLVLTDIPDLEDAAQGRPLVSTINQYFRQAFKKSKLNTIPYMISSVVLCTNAHIDDNGEVRTYAPSDEVVSYCSANSKKLIELCNPDYVLVLGPLVASVFGLDMSSGVHNMSGADWNGAKIVSVGHPSTSDGDIEFYDQLLGDFVMLANKLNVDFGDHSAPINDDVVMSSSCAIDDVVVSGVDTDSRYNGKIYSYKYPSTILNNEYTLMDVQRITNRNEIVLVLKNKDDKKIYHTMSLSDYYYYKNSSVDFMNANMVQPVSELEVITSKPNGSKLHGQYESDVRTEIKHSIDFRYQKEIMGLDSPVVSLNIMYWDIEVFNFGSREFPYAHEAKSPINAISYKINNGRTQVIISLEHTEQKVDDINVPEDYDVHFVDTEFLLLVKFAKIVVSSNIDVMAGWNTNWFDMRTLLNRMRFNQIDINSLSPIRKTYFNNNRNNDFVIGGIYSFDQLDGYKNLTQAVEPSYKLSAIAMKVLKEDKVAYEGSLDDLYINDIQTFIDYSGTDTELLYKLEQKLGHINLTRELINICSTTWKASETSMGQIDPLLISFAKRNDTVCRDATKHPKEKIPGAYVMQPIGGLYQWLVDFDYTALYPSVACSMNIGPNTYVAKIDPDVAVAHIYQHTERLPETLSMIINPIKGNAQTRELRYTDFKSWMNKNNLIITSYGSIFKNHKDELSFFYDIFTYLLGSRVKYKNIMNQAKADNDDAAREHYFTIQWAYKILANSIYGVLGNRHFRFFNKDLATSITTTGKEAIQFIGHHADEYMKTGSDNLDPYFMDDYENRERKYLRYTDTDSIFLELDEYVRQEKYSSVI